MINKRKWLYGAGSVIAIAAPLATVIACGDSGKGEEFKKGESISMYWNSDTKTLTLEIDLGDTDDLNTAHNAYIGAMKEAVSPEFVKAADEKIKGIPDDDITETIIINSRGKTGSATAKGDTPDNNEIISALEKCGWEHEDAKLIIVLSTL